MLTLIAQIKNPAIDPAFGDNAGAAKSGTLFSDYFIKLWQALITVGAVMVIIYFVWGAIEWIVAGGDSSKVQKARDRLTQATIGLIILVGTYTIIGFINSVFFDGTFDIFNLNF